MRRGAAHGRSRGSDAGFTLVELMIALAVLGLAISVVVLTLPGDDSRLDSEAARLAARVAAARDLAIIEGRPVAVWIAPSGNGVDVRAAGAGWQAAAGRALAVRPWPAGVSASIGGGISGGDDAQSSRLDQGRVEFDPLGTLAAPVTIALTAPPARRRVVVAATGEVQIRD